MLKKRTRERSADDDQDIREDVRIDEPVEFAPSDEQLESDAILGEITHSIQQLQIDQEAEERDKSTVDALRKDTAAEIEEEEKDEFGDTVEEQLKHRAKYSSMTVIGSRRLSNYMSERDVQQFFGRERSHRYEPNKMRHQETVVFNVRLKFTLKQLVEYCHPSDVPEESQCVVIKLMDHVVNTDARGISYPCTKHGIPCKNLPPSRDPLSYDDTRILVKRCVVKGVVDQQGKPNVFIGDARNPFPSGILFGSSIHERVLVQERECKRIFGTGLDSYEDELDRLVRGEDIVMEDQDDDSGAPRPSAPPPPTTEAMDDEEEEEVDVEKLKVDEFDECEFSDTEDAATELEELAESDMAMSIKVHGRTQEHQKVRHGNHHYFGHMDGGEKLQIDRVVVDVTKNQKGLYTDDNLLKMVGGAYPSQLSCCAFRQPVRDEGYLLRVAAHVNQARKKMESENNDGDLPYELTEEQEDTLKRMTHALCTNVYISENSLLAFFAKMNVENLGPFGRIYSDFESLTKGSKVIKMTQHLVDSCERNITQRVMAMIPYQTLHDAEFYLYTPLTTSDMVRDMDQEEVNTVQPLDLVLEVDFYMWPREELVKDHQLTCTEQTGRFFNDKFFVRVAGSDKEVAYSRKNVDERVRFEKDEFRRRERERSEAQRSKKTVSSTKSAQKRRRR